MIFEIYLSRPQRRRLSREAARERDAETRQRYRIVLALAEKMMPSTIHRVLGAARSTIYRVARRFLDGGEAALTCRRQEVPPWKVTEAFMERLEELIEMSPRDLGWQRSTWTCELLGTQLELDTGICVHRTHVHRLLRGLGMRWGRPRPTPPGYARTAAQKRRIREIERLLDELPEDEVAVYEDEVDVHLNPKIGPCWMPEGVQFEVETPGQNQKRYIFGGWNPHSGHLVWIASKRKNSGVFIEWLEALQRAYRRYRIIHVIVDNYIIHKSKKTLQAIANMAKINLHFLPPYSPEHNPIERLWGELHANVTRNHECEHIDELMKHCEDFLDAATPYPSAQPSLAFAVASVADRRSPI